MSSSLHREPTPMRAVFAFLFSHWRRHPWLAARIGGAMVLATVTEVFVPYEAGKLIDALALGPSGKAAAVTALITMGLLGFSMIALRLTALAGIVPFTTRMMTDVAAEAFHRVQRLSTDWHANNFAGSTQRKITRGMWALDTLNDTLLLALLPSLTILIGSVALLTARAPVLGAVMAAGSLAYTVAAVLLAMRWIAPASRLSNKWDTRIGGVLADAIGSNAVVKAFAGEAREDGLLNKTLARWRSRVTRTWWRHVGTSMGLLALLWSVRILITGTALWLWWQGRASAGDVAYVITAYLVVHGYLRDVGEHVQHLQQGVNELEELVQLSDVPLGIADRAGARPIAVSGGEIVFDDVGFRYGPHLTPLYAGLDVRIAPGERVGLVGRSGSGKTSFVKLIQRLHDVSDGRITIDGQDIAQATQESLRQQIAIVPQEPILFHRSLADNIAYARPGASLAEIEAAARLANAHDFIKRLPSGYQTLVGERGVKLSGGERQRVALARAFLADAPILILDEATSSLDSESEALIQQAIARLMAGRTAIIIAHRLSTVRNLDRILVFERGRIVEDGTHDSLLEIDGGHYRTLSDHQDGSFEPVLL
jgi:ATP-binding cassette subfamily B protein